MKPIQLVTTGLATLFLFSSARAEPAPEFLGVVNGGGGKGVVCRNADQTIKSVETLDLWEARTLHAQVPNPPAGDLRAEVTGALEKLKNSFYYKGTGVILDDSGNRHEYQDQDVISALLQENAKLFFFPSPKVLRLRGVQLQPTNDALEIAQPTDCAIEQIVNYQTFGQILVNEDLFERLDQVNQAALIAHESYYEFLRSLTSESNSLRVRRAIGFIFSGQNRFEMIPRGLPKGIRCRSSDLPPVRDWISFRANGPAGDGTVNYQVSFDRIGGSELIGAHNVISSFRAPAYLQQVLLSGRCPRHANENYVSGFSMDGPVEYDRNLNLSISCIAGKGEFQLSFNTPGSSEMTPIRLTCAKD